MNETIRNIDSAIRFSTSRFESSAGCKVEHCSGFYRVLYKPAAFVHCSGRAMKIAPVGWRTVAIGRTGRPPFAVLAPYIYDPNDFTPGGPNGIKPTGNQEKDLYWDEQLYGSLRYCTPDRDPGDMMCNPYRFDPLNIIDRILDGIIDDIMKNHTRQQGWNFGVWGRGAIRFDRKGVNFVGKKKIHGDVTTLVVRRDPLLGKLNVEPSLMKRKSISAVPFLKFGLHTASGFPLPDKFNSLVHLTRPTDRDADFFRFIHRFTKTYPVEGDVALIGQAEKFANFVDSAYVICTLAPGFDNSESRVFLTPEDFRIAKETCISGGKTTIHRGRHVLLDLMDAESPIEWLKTDRPSSWGFRDSGFNLSRTAILISNTRKLLMALSHVGAFGDSSPIRLNHISWVHRPTEFQIREKTFNDEHMVSVLERKWPYDETSMCPPSAIEVSLSSEYGNLTLKCSDNLSRFRVSSSRTSEDEWRPIDELEELLQEKSRYSEYNSLDDVDL